MALVPLLLLFEQTVPTAPTTPVTPPSTAGAFKLDEIELGGQLFPIKGFARGNAISEFESGIKIGAATYDQREHAFFIVFDDFSGGFGHRLLDIRNELGTYWDSDPDNSPDMRRKGHITLPMVQELHNPDTNPTTNKMLEGYPTAPFHQTPYTYSFLGFGSAIYYTTDGETWQRGYDASDFGGSEAAGCASIVEFRQWGGGIVIDRRFAAFYPPRNSIYGSTEGNAHYVVSLSPATTAWADPENDPLIPNDDALIIKDMMVFDNKVIGVWGNAIVFGVLANTGNDLQWNFHDENDEEPVAVPPGNIRLVGVATAPWGDPAVYFMNDRKLFVLDFFKRTFSPIELGTSGQLTATTLWGAEIVLTDSWNVYIYSPASQTVRNAGFPRETSIPPSMIGDDGNSYQITALKAIDGHLYALAASASENVTRLFCFNNLGWSQIGEAMPIYANVLELGVYPPVGQVTSRYIHVVGADTPTSTSMRIYNFKLPNVPQVPIVGRTTFGPSGANFTTGWIDGGFNDIYGTLLRLNIDAFNLTDDEKVRIEYQLDNDEDGDWVQMVDTDNAAADFTGSNNVLYFANAAGPAHGIKFRTVRFRITLLRGSDDTLSPELRALTLVYLKTPELRTAWTFEIDIDAMVMKSKTGNLTQYYVDGEAATLENVWAKFRELWSNDHELLRLVIPNIEPDGIYVKLTDMPLTFDDFRDAIVGSRGAMTIQVLEPIERAV